ncbi:hypothetical protein BCR34DRAFT_654176 [Clohesyomyces aquaticus]|uniref:Uncharacterized protein n=1 Tax=Clohesyomyces aquaticus TaxID=1231657 RepID=A0A1Y1ZLN0_9PLEO|nr:hypothetical protein BCR34DRAFT_654176 [Clohesyomyces aquaticus]
MSFFSKVKKAKKAADEHNKTSHGEAATSQAKPPPVPYKHVPTHAAQDSLSVGPRSWSREETRARIHAARRTRSEVGLAQHYARSNINLMLPTSNRSRSSLTQGDLSIDSVMVKGQSQNQQPHIPRHSFTNMPESAPLPPNPNRPSYNGCKNRNSSLARRKSPLSHVSIEEDTFSTTNALQMDDPRPRTSGQGTLVNPRPVSPSNTHTSAMEGTSLPCSPNEKKTRPPSTSTARYEIFPRVTKSARRPVVSAGGEHATPQPRKPLFSRNFFRKGSTSQPAN